MSDQLAGQLKRNGLPRLRIVAAAFGFTLGVLVSNAAAEPKTPETILAVDSALSDSTVLTGKVVYVDFWASWCVPCRKSYPWMKGLYARYHEAGLEIVTINLDKEKAPAEKFLAEVKTNLPVIYDPKGSLAKLYELKVMPSSFVYGRDGLLKLQHEGFQPSDGPDLDSTIAGLLKEAPAK